MRVSYSNNILIGSATILNSALFSKMSGNHIITFHNQCTHHSPVSCYFPLLTFIFVNNIIGSEETRVLL